MKIIFIGVSCVGKSTIGKMLAEKAGYKFFDFDLEIEKYFNSFISLLKTHLPHPFFHKKIIIKIYQAKEELQNMSRIPT